MAEDETAQEEQEATATGDAVAAQADGDGAVATVDGGTDEVDGGEAGDSRNSALYTVPVEIAAVLGTALMPVSQLLKVGRGAILELDRTVGDPVDIYVNNRMVAHGDVIVVDDRLGVTLTETLTVDDVLGSNRS